MLEVFVYYSDAIQRIGLYLLIALVIYAWVAKDYFRSYVMENRQALQKDPVTIPIVVFYDKLYDPNNGTTFLGAFIEMLYAIVREVFHQLMRPIYEIGKMYIRMFEVFREILNTIRKQIIMLRQALTNIFRDIYNRMEVGMASVYFLFFKLRDTMKRIYATTKMMTYVAQHTVNFLDSMMASPIGYMGRKLGDNGIAVSVFAAPVGLGGRFWQQSNAFPACFDPNSSVYLETGRVSHIYHSTRMQYIQLGDRLVDIQDNTRHTVVARIRFNPEVVNYNNAHYIPTMYRMYNVAGVVVSGSHGIHLSKNKMRRVMDDERSELFTQYISNNGIISFITDTGIIPTTSPVTYRDYLDTHSADFYARLRRQTDIALNGPVPQETSSAQENVAGMIPFMTNEWYMKCQDLYTGWCATDDYKDDKIRFDVKQQDILGDIVIAPGQLDMYELPCVPGILLSGNTWISTGGIDRREWTLVCHYPGAKYVGKNGITAYQFITRDNIVTLKNDSYQVRIRDFIEVSDRSYLERQCEDLEEYGFLD
jgi:hypothetical protein